MDVLKETSFAFLGPKKNGKVRDIYEQKDKVFLIATDRHSSFDRIIAHIPRKGEVLNKITLFWFERTEDIIPNHFLESPDPNVTVAKRCEPLPLEAVVRGYLTGVTSTAIWTHYQAGKRDFGNFVLPNGMRKNERLEKPVFTPSTKVATHDETLSPQEMISRGIIKASLLKLVEEKSLALFARGQEIAANRGLILVDTKYEFGFDEKGELTLIDEVHTPDSSRYWFFGSYGERFSRGQEPEYFDKEFLRLWFMEHSDPYKDETLPEAPPELVAELSKRYLAIFERMTGEKLPDLKEPVLSRLQKNLLSYAA